MSAQGRKDLVVIGSGCAGLCIAQHIDNSLYTLTVISPQPISTIASLLASNACGVLPFDRAEQSVRAANRRCNFVRAEAQDVDFKKRIVYCRAAPCHERGPSVEDFVVRFEYLVICPGCLPTLGVPSTLKRPIFTLRDVEDAKRLHGALVDRLEVANLPHLTNDERRELLHVVIVGAGPTAVEIDTSLSNLAQGPWKQTYPLAAKHLRITVYDVSDQIINVYERQLSMYAVDKLLDLGIEVVTDSATRIDGETYLHLNGGDSVPAGILLWMAGNRSNPLLERLNVKKSRPGPCRILTTADLRVLKAGESKEVYPNVFALGDAADIEEAPLPATADVAARKARFLVGHLNRTPRGVQLEIPTFKYRYGRRDWVDDNPYAGSHAWLSWKEGRHAWSWT